MEALVLSEKPILERLRLEDLRAYRLEKAYKAGFIEPGWTYEDYVTLFTTTGGSAYLSGELRDPSRVIVSCGASTRSTRTGA